MPKQHIHRFGVKTFCGITRTPEEATFTKYFAAEPVERCASCADKVRRAGYDMRGLEMRFGTKKGATQ